MNILKKTLGREDVRKEEKVKSPVPNTTAPLRKNKQMWKNIDQLIQNVTILVDLKRADKHSKEEALDNSILQNFKDFDHSKRLLGDSQFIQMLDKLILQCRNHTKISLNETIEPWTQMESLDDRIQLLLQSDKELSNKNLMLLFSEKLKKHIRQMKKKEKDTKLKEFDKVMSVVMMKKKPSAKEQSSNDFILKVTKEEYTIQSRKSPLSKKKSLGTLNSGSLSGSSNHRNNSLTKKGSEGDIQHAKLHSLLKDGSLKMIKTCVKYDYSAILEGSFANIQKRNTTTAPVIKESKPIEKVKKNEGFVFFRPGQRK